MNFGLIVQQVKDGHFALSQQLDGMLAFVGEQDDAATLKECDRQAAAIASYLSQQEDVASHNAAVLLCARVRHRLGQVLADTVNHRGGKAAALSNNVLLKDISRMQSSRFQRLAAIPWGSIDARIRAKTEENERAKLGRIVKELEIAIAAERLRAEPPPLPDGPFRVIAADPPWRYDKRPDDETHRAAIPYPSMTLEQIAALPVAALAHNDCVLWLWTTNAHMRHAFGIAEAWGFTPKTILTWVKASMGTGDWLRGRTEHCLLAVRGKPVVTLTNQTTVIEGPLREHSRKPEEFYALVESLCPGSKVELFSRTVRPGWASHGNEQGRFAAESGEAEGAA